MSLCFLRSLCSAELLWKIKSATTPFVFLGKSCCCCCCCRVFFLSLSQTCFTLQGWITALQEFDPADIWNYLKGAAIVWGMPLFCLWSTEIVISPMGFQPLQLPPAWLLCPLSLIIEATGNAQRLGKSVQGRIHSNQQQQQKAVSAQCPIQVSPKSRPKAQFVLPHPPGYVPSQCFAFTTSLWLLRNALMSR